MTLFYRFTCFCLKAYFFTIHRHRTYGSNHIPKEPCIIAPNHTSFYDPPLVAISSPEEVFFLARKSLFDHRFFGTLIKHLNAFPVKGETQDLSAFKVIFQLLKDKKKLVIFPEGERSWGGNLHAIKPGIGLITLKSNSTIVPTYIHGAYEVWPRTKRFPKLWGKTACVFGSPIRLKKFQTLKKKEAQEAIARELYEAILSLRQWYLDGASGTPP